MTNRENAQGTPEEVGALILGRARVFELRRVLAGVADARAAEIFVWRPGGVFCDQRRIDGGVDSPTQ
jgi:hypothetical protein